MFYSFIGELVMRTAFSSWLTYVIIKYVLDNPNPDVPVIVAACGLISLLFVIVD